MNKVTDADTADADIADGATLAVGGFDLCGIPTMLIRALHRSKTSALAVASNNCGTDKGSSGPRTLPASEQGLRCLLRPPHDHLSSRADDQRWPRPSPQRVRVAQRLPAVPVSVPVPGGLVRRGEVWWVQFDERRLVVLLSEENTSAIQVMQVVDPAGVDISGLGIEVSIGTGEGLPFEGVLRLAFPRPGFTPCTWLTTVSRDDLIQREAVLSSVKLSEIDDALQLADQAQERTPETTAKLSAIRDALRLGELG
ncbi:hypothetical protein J8N05_20815 [Streptomyces sp. BH-SS-21]|uniref:Uncharacterized protein n=1 Tax=Streptomyces liliiviolaceus TaxID=2823109 RepID=A0A940Y0I4_9ACTN|nr:hypothetical protein [Streptomyces liliiviolaceus]